MNFKLKIWRQKDRQSRGKLVVYDAPDVSPNASVLEMLDIVNERLLFNGEEPIAFDSDCREGICGTCSLTINGEAHGPDHPGAACELYMRKFHDGDTITVEPFRARTFPVIKDLVVDRSALDRIVQAGGFISARAGSAPEANSIPIPKHDADLSMDAAPARRRARTRRRCSLPRQKCHTSRFCLKANRNERSVWSAWCKRWMPKVSATAPTLTSAKRSARPKSARASSPN